jgi:glutamate synthase domain-containing protein 2
VLLLVMVFCAVGHDCHHEDCPVCLLTASFRLTLGLTALAIDMFCQCCWHLSEDVQQNAAGRGVTLVALKVKLSD